MKDWFNEKYFEAWHLYECIEMKTICIGVCSCDCMGVCITVLLCVYDALILTSMQADEYKCMIEWYIKVSSLAFPFFVSAWKAFLCCTSKRERKTCVQNMQTSYHCYSKKTADIWESSWIVYTFLYDRICFPQLYVLRVTTV